VYAELELASIRVVRNTTKWVWVGFIIEAITATFRITNSRQSGVIMFSQQISQG
jgi:hypothetical protein